MRAALKGRRIVLGTMVGTVGAFCSKNHALMPLWIEFSQKTQDPIPRNAQYGTTFLTLLSQRAGTLLTFCGLDFIYSCIVSQCPKPNTLIPKYSTPQDRNPRMLQKPETLILKCFKTHDPNPRMLQISKP